MRLFLIYIFFIQIACSTTQSKKAKPLSPNFLDEMTEQSSKQCKPSKKKIEKFKLSKIVSQHPEATKKKYDFSFIDVGIRDALLDLSQQSGITIAMGEEVSGVLSLNIQQRNFKNSLEMIVSSGPYDYKYFPSGYYYVGLSDPDSPSWHKLAYTYQYRANSLLPSKVVEMVNPEFEPYVKADDKLRMLSIFAPKNKLKQIVDMIREIDQSPRQISLKMVISELTEAGRQSLGRNNFTETAQDTLTGLSPVLSLQHPIVLKAHEYSNLMKNISFIQQEGEGSIRAQPALTVLEGEEAIVKTSKQLLIQNTESVVSKPTFLETEIGFSIVPRLTDDNDIILTILKATAGDINASSASSAEVTEQSIATTVRVSPGDSLLLGGMFHDKQQKTVTKVPYLGNLPVLGWFFKNESEIQEKMEVFFAIKPEVLCTNT